MFYKNYVALCKARGLSTSSAAEQIGFARSAVTRWANGAVPHKSTLVTIADFFGVTVDELVGKERTPSIAESYVTFPILGEVAAGYDRYCESDWEGETLDVPEAWLKGRPQSDYFVLRVHGDSMYPKYEDGDIVLVLKQDTLNYSGEIGVVIYDDDKATLKQVQFVYGEDWMKLAPINPQFPPQMIIGEKLEHCRVLGIPKMLIRNIV